MLRRATHRGYWYAGDPSTLAADLQAWLDAANVTAMGAARALIVPHAGYEYSGACSAHAYRHIDRRRVRRLFVLGPSHYTPHRGCCVPTAAAYETPAGGRLRVDTAVVGQLRATRHFDALDVSADEEEHSVEMQLPFIVKVMDAINSDDNPPLTPVSSTNTSTTKSTTDGMTTASNLNDGNPSINLPSPTNKTTPKNEIMVEAPDTDRNYTIVPIIVGSVDPRSECIYGEIFAEYLRDPENIFIVSSDFCHWGGKFNYTLGSDAPQIDQFITNLDRRAMDVIESLNPCLFRDYLQETRNTICGRNAIAILLNAITQAGYTTDNSTMKFLDYKQSSVCRKPTDSCVCYAAAAFVVHGNQTTANGHR